MLAPMIPLTFVVGYQADLAHGNKMDRIRGWYYYLYKTLWRLEMQKLVVKKVDVVFFKKIKLFLPSRPGRGEINSATSLFAVQTLLIKFTGLKFGKS